MGTPALKQYYPDVTEIQHREPTPKERAGIQAEVRVYLYVFGALMLLTLTSITLTSIHLDYTRAAILAISVATIKASLVICFFMHLLGEKKTLFVLLFAPTVMLIALLIGVFLTNFETVLLTLTSGGMVEF